MWTIDTSLECDIINGIAFAETANEEVIIEILREKTRDAVGAIVIVERI